jgi:hypothetical protein
MIGLYYVAFRHSKCLPICLTGTHQRSASKISSIDGDIVICCSSLLSTVSKTCWILTETSGIFYILTWWMGAYTYKEYIPKKVPQEYSILREILPFLAAITTNSEQIFPKMASLKCTISIFGNLPHDQFPFLEI